MPRLRVRIHLNLARPDLAENAVRVQTAFGSWSTVAYANELVLENCVPVINTASQQKIEQGKSRKVPHAYLEGDLVHFKGRLRNLATSRAKALAEGKLVQDPGFNATAATLASQGQPINYNPRFAKCFYIDRQCRNEIQDRFVSCPRLAVVGWKFFAQDPLTSPMLPQDYCHPQALSLASSSEKSVLRRGHKKTSSHLSSLLRPKARTP